MKLHIAIAFALALAACGQQSPPAPAAPQPTASNEFTLTCANFATLTPATIVERYGAENVSTQTRPARKARHTKRLWCSPTTTHVASS